MIERGKYLYEKCYPYVFALLVCYVANRYKIINTEYEEIKDALEAAITVSALIIGFIGAILPIIMGIKSESEYIKAVLESDTKNLFIKYIHATVSSGLFLIGITFILYLKKHSEETVNMEVYIWIYLLIVFLLSTYRCIAIILKLLFSKETISIQEFYNGNSVKDSYEITLEEENAMEVKKQKE